MKVIAHFFIATINHEIQNVLGVKNSPWFHYFYHFSENTYTYQAVLLLGIYQTILFVAIYSKKKTKKTLNEISTKITQNINNSAWIWHLPSPRNKQLLSVRLLSDRHQKTHTASYHWLLIIIWCKTVTLG